MLHITNGDHAAARIDQTGIGGRLIPWRDVLHEGPVPSTLGLEELAPVRARFISDLGWGDYETVLRDFAARDAALAGFASYAEVVLWFEHDLYDQLQLIQVLDWFSRVEPERARLSLICVAEYLGPAGPARLRELFGARTPVSEQQLALGREAWAAFRSPDPSEITTFLERDTAALPYLAAALRRHLEEYPAIGTGLSRSERQALEAIADGEPQLKDAFRAAHHQREDPVFLGDTVFAAYLERLGRGRDPLITFADGRRMRAARSDAEVPRFWSQTATLTASGRAVLSGRADWLAIEPIDRWLGGVHLRHDLPIWRWNAGAGRLELERD